ncbi:MAG: hypothetical protein IPJ74_13540 [Saprospiraceae bacterium]|nr:hypothetical protein [Saprospiraceae bacterium]
MKSPFKFLDAFTRNDGDVFFGRKDETEELFRLVFKTPLLLVYGLSGTGKTSLIQCGLGNKFDGPDWFPLFIRRQNNINESLQQAVNTALNGRAPRGLNEDLFYLHRYYLCPIYLIFDQFEELFILGSAEERRQFIENLNTLLIQNQTAFKIILVMREEYIGQLYDFEKVIPTLFDFRLRVEPMNNAKVRDVVQQSFARFNIFLEDIKDIDNEDIKKDLLQIMIDNLSEQKSSIQLPYLQVYLDMLYREDFQRTYARERQEDELPPLNLTRQEIQDFGQIENVLEKFLREQETAIQVQLSQEHRDVPPQIVRQVLDVFVSEEGTKRPIRFERVNKHIILEEKFQELLPSLPEHLLTNCLEALEHNRLLRFTDENIELAHDSLADLINKKRSPEQLRLNEIRRSLINNFIGFQQTKEFLTRKQLNIYEEFIPILQLDNEILNFIEKSRQYIEAKEQAESARQKRELRRTRQFLIVVSLVAAVALGLFVWALQLQQKAVQATNQLTERVVENYQTNADNLKKEGRYREAIEPIRIALGLIGDANPTLKTNLDSTANILQQIATLVENADSLARIEEELPNALRQYQKAYDLSPDNILQANINRINNQINQLFINYKDRALNILSFSGCPFALPYLQKAQTLKPGDAEVEAALSRCQ